MMVPSDVTTYRTHCSKPGEIETPEVLPKNTEEESVTPSGPKVFNYPKIGSPMTPELFPKPENPRDTPVRPVTGTYASGTQPRPLEVKSTPRPGTIGYDIARLKKKFKNE